MEGRSVFKSHTGKEPSQAVESVTFSFMTDEDVRNQSVVKVTDPKLMDERGLVPTPNGLYDPEMGIIFIRQTGTCQHCGNIGLGCTGHPGHMEFDYPIYNPSTFNLLCCILKRTCFYCHRFKEKKKVKTCVSQLKHITQGKGKQTWTSLQFVDASNVMDKALKSQLSKKCEKCQKESPKLEKLAFGWILMADGANQKERDENFKLGLLVDKDSRDLSPIKVKELLKDLWKKQKRFCSYIGDLCRSGSERNDYSMFFLESLVVPPPKFRPPIQKGDSFQEHPQTLGLSKVLQSSITLGDALSEELDSSQIINRWMDLQKSVNVLFKSYNATVQGKKQGLFRQNMMGKQVNYVCKSVISRDPYIPLNEIGIPLIIAKKLTYPERVTGCNLDKLMKALINGPDIYPGATHYRAKEFLGGRESGTQLARKLLSRLEKNQIVDRHMQDGDVVLVNHQPALHKPSIRAHIVRVMKGEETVRMHYANCSTYNADFDGDVIVHFPQDEISRAEAYNIVNANNQYARPSNGGPLRSLIEDHIVSSVLLTKRDTFLDKDEFCQLLFSSGVTDTVLGSFSGRSGKKKVMVSASDAEPLIVTPAILKPVPLWTGKQVITAVLNQITKGHPPLTVEKATKLPVDFFNCRSREVKLESGESNIGESWKRNLNEDKLLIIKNEFVCGVIDKAQFEDYGLVHTVHELCGSNAAGNLLSVLSRLFTVFLQIHGFTCGVDDLIILEDMAEKGKKQLQECEQVGERVLRKIFGIDVDVQIDTKDMISRIQKHNDRESALAYLDRSTANELNQCSNKGVMNDFLSDGLLKTPGKNCMSLMTLSGAKGSKVNFQQISSHLGQQDIAGERVPRMVSGKTLPCFHPWDWSPRAGGFISDSFLSGLRPQEYYFHCMAGRERLVDTEVKISDSGYLQRCLIKNLESLKVNYDCTVRDADGSIIQFQYGEDGVDVHQSSFIGKFKELTLNQDLILHRYSEDMLSGSSSYITDLPSTLKTGAEKFIEAMPVNEASKLERKEELLKLVKLKFFASLTQPGEPVGVLAGQSVGESSTRMTLNTFHLAGSGEMNGTLGIPRLQEILMTDTKTPIMTCPLLKGKTNDDANVIADKLRKITVADIIASVEVEINPQTVHESEVCCIYKLKMNLHNPEPYLRHTDVTDQYLNETITVLFLGKLEDAIEAHMKMLYRTRWGTGSEAGNETDNNDAVIGNDPADDEGEGREADDGIDYEENSEDNEDENAEVGEEEIPEPQQEEEMPEPQQEEEMPEPQQEEEMPELMEEEEMPELQQEEEMPEPQQEEEMPELMEDRIIFSHRGDNSFEVHFKFPIEEPRILIAEIALKTAKEVYIQKPGKIERCRVVNCGDPQVIYHGENPKERKEISYDEKKASPALYVSGVDSPMMSTIMLKFKDTLDVRYMYSNSIHNMLNTFGVEAARETILRELNDVFKSCGISVSIRHLNLIADYMTVSGRYRPFKGGIAGSTSPFCRMTCETATKFLVQAATYGEKDTLETPSARICLGLPVRSGTGCFDLMQRVEL